MGFIDISGCDVTDAGVANLAKCSELTTVRISSRNVTDKSIMLLGNFFLVGGISKVEI